MYVYISTLCLCINQLYYPLSQYFGYVVYFAEFRVIAKLACNKNNYMSTNLNQKKMVYAKPLKYIYHQYPKEAKYVYIYMCVYRCVCVYMYT